MRKQPSRGGNGNGAAHSGEKNGHAGADTYFPDASIIQDLNFEETSASPWMSRSEGPGFVPGEGKEGGEPCDEGDESASADKNGYYSGGGSGSGSGSDYSGDM